PTTALDDTGQAQGLDLLAELRRELTMGLLLIAHDLGGVADVADALAVMSAGRSVARAPGAEV
ncbi:methionine ABC transporter ATP-binding protein, partial [Streptomyces sp. DT9]